MLEFQFFYNTEDSYRVIIGILGIIVQIMILKVLCKLIKEIKY